MPKKKRSLFMTMVLYFYCAFASRNSMHSNNMNSVLLRSKRDTLTLQCIDVLQTISFNFLKLFSARDVTIAVRSEIDKLTSNMIFAVYHPPFFLQVLLIRFIFFILFLFCVFILF
ncbi:hypothetical protein BDF21DRAFT_40049 [Thamnidium elegans]|nr:hypothetical protein BDF21DRAFT_40049 [Thamnidium elegans]